MVEQRASLDSRKLLHEYREAIYSHELSIAKDTAAIMVLAANSLMHDLNEGVNFEDRVRILTGWYVLQQVVSQKLDKPIAALTREEMILNAPLFIFNSTTEQLPKFIEYAQEQGIPKSLIKSLSCGSTLAGTANTRTHFLAFNHHPELQNIPHVTLITSGYHVPRVNRTASKNLNSHTDFTVVGAPLVSQSQKLLWQVVRGEMKRIKTYTKRGHISFNKV